MPSHIPKLICFSVIGIVAVVQFGCRKEKEAPAPGAVEEPSEGYEALLPKKDVPEGWGQSGAVRLYVGKKLYDSIDGAADRFFQYAFREQYVAGYSKKKPGTSINVEVYDMGTPDDAFGIFSCHDNIVSEHTDIGLAATISEMNLDFCKGKYFVRLLAMGFDEGEAERPLRAFAEAIAGNIEPAGQLPELVRRLPEGYLQGTALFFHTWQTLSERRYIAEENVFRLDRKTNGVLAAYTAEERKADDQTLRLEKDVLFLVEYPDKKAAQDAKMSSVKFFTKLAEESRAEGKPPSERLQFVGLPEELIEVYQLYKGEGAARRLTTNMRVFGNYIFGVWEITDADKAKGLLKTLAGKLNR